MIGSIIIAGSGKPRIVKEIATTDSEYYLTAGVTAYTTLGVTDSVALPAQVRIGKRIRAKQITNIGGLDYELLCWGKITGVNTGAKTITVDQWIGGTPTNTQFYAIDGYVADLPRCEKLTETFTPQLLIHSLWRFRKATKDYGYAYACKLDYQNYGTPDMFAALKDVLQQTIQGGDETYVLIPRMDKPGFNYNVYIEDGLDFILSQDQRYYEGFMMIWKGKDGVSRPPQVAYSGYGCGYAQNYGIQL